MRQNICLKLCNTRDWQKYFCTCYNGQYRDPITPPSSLSVSLLETVLPLVTEEEWYWDLPRALNANPLLEIAFLESIRKK